MSGQLKPATKVSRTLKEMLNDVIEQAQKEADINTAFMFKQILEDEKGRHNHFTARRDEA